MRRFSGRRITRRVVAIAAAGIVIAAGATATSLAAWTDTEWVFGSATGTNHLGTSVFGVQQSVAGDGATTFVDRSTSAGAGAVTFSVTASSLSPGTDIFGYVNLRTITNSLGATVVLNGATQGTGTDSDLFTALKYQVRVVGPAVSCDASVFSAATSGSIQEIVPSTTALGTGSGSSTFTLAANGAGGTALDKRVCFKVSLPAGVDSSLQGKGANPIWNFVSTSV